MTMAETTRIWNFSSVQIRIFICRVRLDWMVNILSLVALLMAVLKIRKINDCQFKRVGDLPIDFTYGACGTSNDLIQKPDNSPDQHGILRETAMSHWHNQHTSSWTHFPIMRNYLAVKIKATLSDTFHSLWTSLWKSDWRSCTSDVELIRHHKYLKPHFLYKGEFVSFSSS